MEKQFTQMLKSLHGKNRHDLLAKMELADWLPYVDSIMQPDRNWQERHPDTSGAKRPRIGLVGINVHVRTMNYACPLHCYAMQQYLRGKGYEVEVLDYVPDFNILEEFYDYGNPAGYYRTIKAVLEEELRENGTDEDLKTAYDRACRELKNVELNADILSARAVSFREFKEKYLNMTPVRYDREKLDSLDPGCDIYMCASDIIWDKFYSAAYDRGFFLDGACMESKWKIAYAASKWTKWTRQDLFETSEMLRKIDFISVRESFLQEEIQRCVRHDVAWVVDPVLLNDASLYRSLAVPPEAGEYVLLYCAVEEDSLLFSECLKRVESIRARTGICRLVVMADCSAHLSKKEFPGVEAEYRFDAGIGEWLGYILNASWIYTNSYHCLCFCTLFRKDFHATKRSHYDKIGDFLEPVGLGRRILNSRHIIPEDGPVSNWEEVDEKLGERIRTSKLFLNNALTIASEPYPAAGESTFPIFGEEDD